jgi:hypothetical protein
MINLSSCVSTPSQPTLVPNDESDRYDCRNLKDWEVKLFDRLRREDHKMLGFADAEINNIYDNGMEFGCFK